MPIQEFASGSFTIPTTPYYLVSNSTTPTYQNTSGIYQLFVDLANIPTNGIWEIGLVERARSTGTTRTVYIDSISDVIASQEPIYASPSFVLMHGWEFYMRAISGSGVSVPWSVRRVY